MFRCRFPLLDFLSHDSLAGADPCRLGSAFPEGKVVLHYPALNRRHWPACLRQTATPESL